MSGETSLRDQVANWMSVMAVLSAVGAVLVVG